MSWLVISWMAGLTKRRRRKAIRLLLKRAQRLTYATWPNAERHEAERRNRS